MGNNGVEMKYKVVKAVSAQTGNDMFIVYRQRFGFMWQFVQLEFSLKEAERAIDRDKERQKWKKQKPVVVGYY